MNSTELDFWKPCGRDWANTEPTYSVLLCFSHFFLFQWGNLLTVVVIANAMEVIQVSG